MEIDSDFGNEDRMLKFLRFVKLTIGGAALAVAAAGTVAGILGFDMTVQHDLLAAAFGGGATGLALLKISMLA